MTAKSQRIKIIRWVYLQTGRLVSFEVAQAILSPPEPIQSAPSETIHKWNQSHLLNDEVKSMKTNNLILYR